MIFCYLIALGLLIFVGVKIQEGMKTLYEENPLQEENYFEKNVVVVVNKYDNTSKGRREGITYKSIQKIRFKLKNVKISSPRIITGFFVDRFFE